jgi:uncharacterized protein with PQ loop repeat
MEASELGIKTLFDRNYRQHLSSGTLQIGYIATFLGLVQNVPQIFKNMRDRDTRELSIFTVGLGIIISILWYIYAIQNKDVPLQLSSILTGITFAVLLWQKFLFGKHDETHRQKDCALCGVKEF